MCLFLNLNLVRKNFHNYKRHYSLNLKRFLKLSEIFQLPLEELIRTEGEKNNIKLINLTSDEIKDFAIETMEHF